MVNKAGKPVVKNALRKKIVDEYKQLLSAPTDPESLQRLRGLLTAARQVEPGVFPTIHKFAFPKDNAKTEKKAERDAWELKWRNLALKYAMEIDKKTVPI